MAETYAIVESGGKQYRATEGATLLVDRVGGDEGAKVTLRPVMFRGEKDSVVVKPDELEKVKVEAVVTEHLRGEKVRVFKYRAKKGYRKRAGHRSELTKLEVKSVKMLSRKPAAKKDEAEAKPKPAARKAPAKKPAAKKAPAKKPAARRKPAAKKESA
jgi:large subunit ribosomal protein L21